MVYSFYKSLSAMEKSVYSGFVISFISLSTVIFMGGEFIKKLWIFVPLVGGISLLLLVMVTKQVLKGVDKNNSSQYYGRIIFIPIAVVILIAIFTLFTVGPEEFEYLVTKLSTIAILYNIAVVIVIGRLLRQEYLSHSDLNL